MGELADFKLHSVQLEIYKAFKASPEKKFVLNCSRRLGKSYLALTLALEHCLQVPNCQVRYAAPTASQLKKIIMPMMRELIADCPEELRPKFIERNMVWRFPHNDSEIHFAGTDSGNVETLRGLASHFCIVDEAGSCDDLHYVVDDVLMPQLLTTGGRLLMLSSPPRYPGHPFQAYAEAAMAAGSYVKKTIHDNPMLDRKTIDAYEHEAGGKHSSTFLREYMAEFVIDLDRAIVPEFTPEAKAELVVEREPPQYRDCYVSLDIGFTDWTVALFAYYDYKRAKVVVEDEYCARKVTTDVIAGNIKQKERELWGDREPSLRVSDTNMILISDLSALHGLHFSPTTKDNKDAQVNMLNIWFRDRRIELSPRCRRTIAQLENGVWNKNHTQFARSSEHGHYDAIDSLIYLLRNVATHKNPYPPKFATENLADMYFPRGKPSWDKGQQLTTLLKKVYRIAKWQNP